MKPQLLTSISLAVTLLATQGLSAQLIFEDDFSTQASLENWVVNVAEASTVELVEAAQANMDGYLKVFDGDPAATPTASHDFGPTETGYLDVRMSGTKFAGSGVIILYSVDGPLFSLSLNVSNTDIKSILNGVADMDGRENDVFIEPLNLALESPTFPYGRDIRLTWSNGMLSLYYTGIDGTVYMHVNKAYALPDATPSGVSLAAGFDSANGKTGFFDSITISAGVPDSGPGSGSDWALWPIIDEAGNVDTGSWMGFLNVGFDPYIWSYSINQWMYIDAASVTEGGSWTYVFNF